MTTTVEKGLLIVVRLGVFLALLMPLVVTQSTLFPYVVGKAIYARSLAEITFACWVILALRNPAYRPPRSWVLWLFGMSLFISFIAALVGVSFQRSFWGDYRRMGGVFDLAHWFAYAVVLVSVLKDARQWRWLLNANLGISLLIALLGLAQHYDIRVFDRVFWYLQPTGRIDITFGNATYVGAYMLVNVFIALAFLAHSYQRLPQPLRRQSRGERRRRRAQGKQMHPQILPWRAFWVATAALDFWVLTLSGTRGAVVGLVVGLLLVGVGYVVWGSRGRLKLLVGALMAALLLVALVAPLVRDTSLFQDLAQSNVAVQRFDRLMKHGLEDPSIQSRIRTAGAGLEAFIHTPVLGWGPENFAVAFDRYADALDLLPGTSLADQAHNKPIEELTTKGILGFIGYVLLIGWMVWVVVRTIRREPEERFFVLFMGAALIAYVVQNLFLFDTPATFLQFILLLGWVAGRERLRDAEPFSLPLRGAVADMGGQSSHRSPGSRAVRHGGVGAAEFSPWVWLGATASILIVAVTLLYLFNYRPYRAAQLFSLESTSLGKFFEDARASFETFPPLATMNRQILFDTLAENWERQTKSEEVLLLRELEAEGEAALKSEPQNARLHLGLASIYQRAGASDPAYLLIARSHLEMAQRLAPRLLETLKAAIQQEVAEGDYAQALTMVYQYRGSDPVRAGIIMDMVNRLQLLLIGQIGEEEYVCRWAGKEQRTLEERAQIQCKEKPTS